MRRVVIGLVGLIALAGCAPGPKAQDPARPAANLPSFVFDGEADPDRETPSDHWEVTYFKSDDASIAGIIAGTKDNMIMVTCAGKDLFIQVGPRDELPGPLDQRRIAFAFDGAAPIEQPWRAERKKHWWFSAGFGEPGFAEIVQGLKQHRTVETFITDQGKPAMHQTYTLRDAPKTIDYVLQACGKNV